MRVPIHLEILKDMSLSSGIAKRFKQLFVLDDDGLRRIEGILNKAAQSYSEPLKVTYHVEREDDRFFETHELDDVLADPNVRGRRIKLIGIELRKVSSLQGDDEKGEGRVALIVFDKDEPPFQEPDIRVRISSPDKTWALMLADEVEPQLTRLFKIKRFPIWVFYLFAPIFGLVVYRSSVYFGNASPRTVLHGLLGIATFALGVIGTRAYGRLSENKSWLAKHFAAEPIFLWGEEVTAYNERETIKKNIFWVVIVGFFVSFVASIATLLL